MYDSQLLSRSGESLAHGPRKAYEIIWYDPAKAFRGELIRCLTTYSRLIFNWLFCMACKWCYKYPNGLGKIKVPQSLHPQLFVCTHSYLPKLVTFNKWILLSEAKIILVRLWLKRKVWQESVPMATVLLGVVYADWSVQAFECLGICVSQLPM